MGTVVMKFGGSSVADVPRLRTVAGIVTARHRGGDHVVVVVSAMGKTTDSLIAMAREVAPEPPRRELDMLVTAGERISMALLSMAIHAAGGDAISFTGSQSGIITEDAHQGARIVEVRPERVREALEKGKIAIVAGFQGVSRKREITTLGRGGSDTTAVAMAAALHADACEIYSDVDGVYTADPNVCPQARLLPEVGYETMQAMASSGAKVLNAQAVEFARRAGIVIHARKTGDATGRETVVRGAPESPRDLVAVVGASAVSWVRGGRCDAAKLLGALSDAGAMLMYGGVGDHVDLLIDRTGIPGRDAGRVAAIAGDSGLSAEPVALVSVVGAAIGTTASVQDRAARVLAAAGIEARGWYAAHQAVAAVVALQRCDEAVRVLHQAFLA